MSWSVFLFLATDEVIVFPSQMSSIVHGTFPIIQCGYSADKQGENGSCYSTCPIKENKKSVHLTTEETSMTKTA